jgi:hypothetical protein
LCENVLGGFVVHVRRIDVGVVGPGSTTLDLQRDALVEAGVDHQHLHNDKASGAPMIDRD